jgi:hypothetical protein
MNMKLKTYLSICLASFVLSACIVPTPLKKEKVDPNAEQVQNLAVVIRMADLSKVPQAYPSEITAYRTVVRSALENRFPEIIRANGVHLTSIEVKDVREVNEPLSRTLSSDSKATHALHITPLSVSIRVNRVSDRRIDPFMLIRYAAELLDIRTRKVVWKATLETRFVAQGVQPLLYAQGLAAEVLNGMNSDGFITLKQENAIDLSGNIIKGYSIWADDK